MSASVNSLPEELILEVLIWLPNKYLLRSRCVSKVLLNLIDCPVFKKRYDIVHNSISDFSVMFIEANNLFSMDFQLQDNLKFSTGKEVGITHLKLPTFIGCCNGVVCVMNFSPALVNYILLNPFNGTSQMVNCSSLRPRTWKSSIGFGYDHATDDYKIVRSEGTLDNIQYVYVYSMNNDSLKQVVRNFSPGCSGFVNGICMEGAIHWLWRNDDFYTCIAAFDLETESFRSVPLPPQIETRHLILHDLGGRLCVCVKSSIIRTSTIVWVMTEYGVETSWTPLTNILNEFESLIGYFPLWDNSRLLCSGSESRLWLWLNTQDGSKEKIQIHKLPPKQQQYHVSGYGTQSWICVRSPRRLGCS